MTLKTIKEFIRDGGLISYPYVEFILWTIIMLEIVIGFVYLNSLSH